MYTSWRTTSPSPSAWAASSRPCPRRQGSICSTSPARGDTVYFDWFHFLADGHGVSRFLTRILMEYCNRRYGAGFDCPPLPSAPAYDMDALVALDPTAGQERLPEIEPVQPEAGQLCRSMVRLDKQSLVDAALACGVKPVSALLGLLSLAMQPLVGRERVEYCYPPTPAAPSRCPTPFTTVSPPSAMGWTPGQRSAWRTLSRPSTPI